MKEIIHRLDEFNERRDPEAPTHYDVSYRYLDKHGLFLEFQFSLTAPQMNRKLGIVELRLIKRVDTLSEEFQKEHPNPEHHEQIDLALKKFREYCEKKFVESLKATPGRWIA